MPTSSEFNLHYTWSFDFEGSRVDLLRTFHMTHTYYPPGTRYTGWIPQRRAEIEWLQHADAIWYIADSRSFRAEANPSSFDQLRDGLSQVGRSLDAMPVMIQLNWRDAPDCTPVEDLRRDLHTRHCRYAETIARGGVGVVDAFRQLVAMIDESRS
jgi:hypothetical protein